MRITSARSTTHRFIFLLLLLLPVLHPAPAPCQETVELQPYLRTVTLTGFTYPLQEITITSEVSGRCLHFFVDIGETVSKKGQLAEIDTTFIQLDIEANRIAQEQTRRQLTQEEKNLARYTALLSQKSTPQAQLDEVVLAADLHKITLKKLHNEEVRLKEQLARHSLSAPPGWKLIERYTEPGEVIQAGKAVALLGDFRKLLVPLAVSYTELQDILLMSNLQIYLPDINETVATSIYRTSPLFDPKTRKIKIELAIDASHNTPQNTLRGGMRAELQFATKEKTGAFLVPSSALVNRYEAHWLVQPDGSRIQVVFQGNSRDRKFAIVSGNALHAGQRFLAKPDSSNPSPANQ